MLRVCLSMGHACDPELDGLAVGHQPDDAGCPCVNLARMGACEHGVDSAAIHRPTLFFEYPRNSVPPPQFSLHQPQRWRSKRRCA
jgi:hypothetical protein